MTQPSTLEQEMRFELTSEQKRLVGIARELGKSKFQHRAAHYDREASFPYENYQDLREAGFLGLCIPKRFGGIGASFQTYMLVAAEIGRWCGATALTFNMHTCSTTYPGMLMDACPLSEDELKAGERARKHHFGRIIEEGKLYSQPFSETGEDWTTRPYATSAKRVDGGWLINGRKIFASLSSAADFHGIVCTEINDGPPRFEDTLFLAVATNTPGLEIVGDWDPLGMRPTVSRNIIMKDVFVPEQEQIMPRGTYFRTRSLWPHSFVTISPAYMGIAQGAYEFTCAYLKGEIEGMPPVKRRHYPTKRLAVAEMAIALEQTRAIYLRMISEAVPTPDREALLRMYIGHYTVMENAAKITQLAIRTCGGQAMLRSLPLERLYRDSRCGSLMLPFTAEICQERIGLLSLYSQEEMAQLTPPKAE
ncbi:acyl-CoA dehydrogenase family protein [Variovorax dokdonensis]|uniref:Acyl-CoA dehydrogenase family protein n=1 Tax=Variovorax dokdonensis TaxID=344883 RepID=A0ABT7N7I4_9BURK|nr:acyl-CoA dehydrogenase family protein [Variovorax dokdonensis]MDM0043909.1 acyl-CoA dehydrogenase family protein [Variovorax dokdonensis]